MSNWYYGGPPQTRRGALSNSLLKRRKRRKMAAETEKEEAQNLVSSEIIYFLSDSVTLSTQVSKKLLHKYVIWHSLLKNQVPDRE